MCRIYLRLYSLRYCSLCVRCTCECSRFHQSFATHSHTFIHPHLTCNQASKPYTFTLYLCTHLSAPTDSSVAEDFVVSKKKERKKKRINKMNEAKWRCGKIEYSFSAQWLNDIITRPSAHQYIHRERRPYRMPASYTASIHLSTRHMCHVWQAIRFGILCRQ